MKQIINLMLQSYYASTKPFSIKRGRGSSPPNISLRILLPLLALTLSLLLYGCTEETPLEIGYIGGLTGRVADLGISGRNGALLAIEHRNSLGGIHGRPVHLVAVDDKQDKQIAEKAFTSLVDQHVEAVIGHMTSSMSVATVPMANKERIVMMSPTTTTTALSGIDDYFFRVCATTDIYGKKMAGYLRNTKKLARVTVIFDLKNKAYTESWINHFSNEFIRLGGTIVQKVTYTSSPDVHFDDLASQALQKETDGLIISSSAVDAGMICQQIRKLDRDVIIATSEWAATEKLIELGGTAVENIVVSQFFDRFSIEPRYLQFKEEFTRRFGQPPGFASVSAYDATNVVLEALARKEKNQDLKQVILDVASFEGIQGEILLDRFGDSKRKTYLSIIRNGKFVSPDNEKSN